MAAVSVRRGTSGRRWPWVGSYPRDPGRWDVSTVRGSDTCPARASSPVTGTIPAPSGRMTGAGQGLNRLRLLAGPGPAPVATNAGPSAWL